MKKAKNVVFAENNKLRVQSIAAFLWVKQPAKAKADEGSLYEKYIFHELLGLFLQLSAIAYSYLAIIL
jgi:hypothetical protein